jgi:hypothetical protein
MPYCDICHSENCEHQDHSCLCGCGDKPNVNCVYDTLEQRHVKNLMNGIVIVEPDRLYQEAKDIAKEIGFVTVSSLQRKMRIGYTHAARLIDTMVDDGFCEQEPDTTGKRKIVAPNTASTGQERDSAHEPALSNSTHVPAQGA